LVANSTSVVTNVYLATALVLLAAVSIDSIARRGITVLG